MPICPECGQELPTGKCQRCGVEIEPEAENQQYCEDCEAEVVTEP